MSAKTSHPSDHYASLLTPQHGHFCVVQMGIYRSDYAGHCVTGMLTTHSFQSLRELETEAKVQRVPKEYGRCQDRQEAFWEHPNGDPQ